MGSEDLEIDEVLTIIKERILTNEDLANKDLKYKEWFIELGIDPKKIH